jgi:choline monooxygenase
VACQDADPIVLRLREGLAALKGLPSAQARTVEPAYYNSRAFLDFEREHVFRKEWICVGHAAELRNPGDYFTTTMIDEPLLVVRGEDGRIRVLSNVCRHRGNLVAKASGNRKRFTCSYHAWTYGLDGRLAAAPLMTGSEAFRKEDCGLPEFATEIWQDFIFVNFRRDAPPLAQRLDAFVPTIANYHPVGRHHQHSEEDEWGANWKCLVENFMEGYHLSAAHLKTLHPITPTSLCRKIPAPFGMTAYASGYHPNVPERGPYPADLTAEERRASVLFSVFPNLVVAIVPNVTLYMVVNPVDADRVSLRWGLAGTIADPQHPEVTAYRDLCFAFNAEDREQLEGVQKGMKTAFLRSGPLAPPDFEGAIWDFIQYMAAKVGLDSGAPAHSAAAA